MGYSYKAGLFSAEEVGASHRRIRLFWLADSGGSRSKARFSESQQREEEQPEIFNYSSNRGWPARPGEQQHEWEEPRTVADSKSGESGQSETGNGGQSSKRGSKEGESSGGTKDKCELGGAVNGIRNRVDRLRLLGNGVVPHTAELAWRVLNAD